MKPTTVQLRVNGRAVDITGDPMQRLSVALREELNLEGTKVGCDAGDCGACSILIDGDVVCACLTPLGQAADRTVETVEGLARTPLGSALQRSFLRNWGAQCGFCTPGMLMAGVALLQANPSPTISEIETSLSGVLCRCTGYRQIIDSVASVAAADTDEPDPVAVGKAVGASVERVDGLAKVNGTERFGDDAVPDDAIVLRAVRSPHSSARFTIDDLAGYVERTPGVIDAFAADAVPGRNYFGVIPDQADQPILADGETRFEGEAVIIVACEPGVEVDLTTLPIAWEPLQSIDDPDEADDGPPIHIHRPDNVLIEGFVETGDPVDAERSADVVVERSYRTSFVEHAYLEPEAGWAVLDDGLLVIHVTTQCPHMDRDETAAVLGLEPERVVIRPTACGGGFGGKLDLSIQPLLGLAALRLGRPVRMVYSRQESMASTTKRHPANMHVRLGADTEGRVQVLDFDATFDTGAYASWGPTVSNRVPIHAGGPYRYPAYRAKALAVHTNQPPSGAFRGFGVPQAAIAQECLFDEMADQLGIDPLEFRLINALRAGQPTVTGQVFSSGVGYVECLEALRAPRLDALARAEEFNRVSAGGPLRAGVGLAGGWYGCGNTSMPNPSSILLGLTPKGVFRLHQGAVDIGQGSNTVMSQICADALGVPLERVVLVDADTDHTPDAGKTSASRQTYISGNATYLAGRQMLARLASLAGLDGAEHDLGLRHDDGGLIVTSGGRSARLELDELPLDDRGYAVSTVGTYDAPTSALDPKGQGEPYAVFGFGAQVVELLVDTRLGRVELQSIDAAFDVGRAVNPAMVRGQIIGGVAQGIGLALMEEYLPGRNNNFHDYLIPTIGDVPEVRVTLIESGDPLGPYGAKGVGEHSLIPTAPAILNAIRNATGRSVTHVPATPERIREAMNDG